MKTKFIGESIEVDFDQAPFLEKKPHCHNRFTRRGDDRAIQIAICLSEWQNFERRGRSANNMRPENLKRAAGRGSWGVGRYFFRVQIETGEIYDLYYDRAPQGTKNRKGSWTLYQQIFDNA